jgi:hypothetical protein
MCATCISNLNYQCYSFPRAILTFAAVALEKEELYVKSICTASAAAAAAVPFDLLPQHK